MRAVLLSLLTGLLSATLPSMTLSAPNQTRASEPDPSLGGTLTSVGSDTLGNLMTRWAEAFQQHFPQVVIQVQTPGSSSAPIALTEGAASFGAMSREMNTGELQRFADRYGYAPTRLTVARDAIVLFVHPDNPLQTLNLIDIAALFGKAGACTRDRSIERWGDLDAPLPGATAQRVLRIGRNGVSGTAVYFSEATLCGVGYRDDVVQMPGSGAVVAAVAAYPNAIGYAGIGYINGLVKPLALRVEPSTAPIRPDVENIRSGAYPLSRPLYLYVNLKPGSKPPVLLASFFRFILSAAGQDLASREGFLAVSDDQRNAQLATLHLAP